MEQKPGGTPNPLNPNQGPAEPVRSTEVDNLMGVVTDRSGVAVESETIDPMNRPMEQATPPEAPQPKKKKMGLFVGMIICLFLTIGCGVTAILLFIDANKPDPVAIATERLISGNAPTNVATEGSLSFEVKDLASPISHMQISIIGEGMTKSMINSSRAMIDINLRNGGSFSIGLDEVYAANGDLYFKLDGINDALNDPYLFGTNTSEEEAEPTEAVAEIAETEALPDEEPVDEHISAENCSSAENCLTAEPAAGALVSSLDAAEALKAIDGVWIRASVDNLNAMFVEATGEDNISCLVSLVTNVNENSNSLAEMYSKNPFVVSATGKLELEGRNDPTYKLSVDGQKFAGFMDEAQSSTTIENLSSCLGYQKTDLNAERLLVELQKLPEIFVEINANYDFTRLYFNTDLGGDADMAVDFGFSYPDNINVSEPVEYKDLDALMQELEAKNTE